MLSHKYKFVPFKVYERVVLAKVLMNLLLFRCVIPMKMGIQFHGTEAVATQWIPAFAGMTTRLILTLSKERSLMFLGMT